MATGILSRRCDCGLIHFFVQDRQTACWLAGRTEKSLSSAQPEREASPEREAPREFSVLPHSSSSASTGDIFIFGVEAGSCSRCGDKVIVPSLFPSTECNLDFPYSRGYAAPDPLHVPLPVHPAPPKMEALGQPTLTGMKMGQEPEDAP